MFRGNWIAGTLVLALVAAGDAAGQAQAKQRTGPAVRPQQNQTQVRTQEAARTRESVRVRSGPEWKVQARDRVRQMLQHEHRHRIRMAKLDRMEAIFRQQGRMDRVRQVDALRTRLLDRQRDRERDCQDLLGDRDWDRLQDRLRDRDQRHDAELLKDRDRLRDRDRIDRG